MRFCCLTPSTGVAASGSKAGLLSIFGEDMSAEEDSKASSISGEDGSASASSSSGEGSSCEGDLEVFESSSEGESAEEDFESESNVLAYYVENYSSKRVRQAVIEERINAGPKLDLGLWSTLDDDLLEKIIARLPLKSLFQASSLSKTWKVRFHSHSFQSEVHNSSSASSWKSYAPLFFNEKAALIGYESSSNRWHRLPSHSYLQDAGVQHWSLRAGAGSLLCWTSPFADATSLARRYQVHVTNPLTRSWKQLPPPQKQYPGFVHIGCEGSKGYKVISGTLKTLEAQQGRVCICLEIFDSTDDSWAMESYINTGTECAAEWGGSVFISGVVYMLVFTLELREELRQGYTLISFDVKQKIWKEIPHVYRVFEEDQESNQVLKFYDHVSKVFVCGSNVMLLIFHSSLDSDFDDDEDALNPSDALSVFRLDLERGLALEVSRAPKEMLCVGGFTFAAGHGDCIYIGLGDINSSSICYNVGSQEWHWINSAAESLSIRDRFQFSSTRMRQWRWASAPYQPGLNPFLKV